MLSLRPLWLVAQNGVEREGNGALRFLRADGRTIPRGGYREDDFTDQPQENPSAEGFVAAMGREPAAVYRALRPS